MTQRTKLCKSFTITQRTCHIPPANYPALCLCLDIKIIDPSPYVVCSSFRFLILTLISILLRLPTLLNRTTHTRVCFPLCICPIIFQITQQSYPQNERNAKHKSLRRMLVSNVRHPGAHRNACCCSSHSFSTSSL